MTTCYEADLKLVPRGLNYADGRDGMALFFKLCKGTHNSFHSLYKTQITLESTRASHF